MSFDARPGHGTPIDLDKLRSLAVIGQRSRDRHREGRDADGKRFKETTDQLGNVVTQRAGDRQDVTIHAPHIRVRSSTEEVRDVNR